MIMKKLKARSKTSLIFNSLRNNKRVKTRTINFKFVSQSLTPFRSSIKQSLRNTFLMMRTQARSILMMIIKLMAKFMDSIRAICHPQGLRRKIRSLMRIYLKEKYLLSDRSVSSQKNLALYKIKSDTPSSSFFNYSSCTK